MSQELFNEWLDHPITKLVGDYLKETEKDLHSFLISEANIYEDHYDRIMSKTVGALQIIRNLRNISYEEVSVEEVPE